MVKKRLTGLAALMLPFVFMQAHLGLGVDDGGKKRSKMERAVSALPDSAYEQVKKKTCLMMKYILSLRVTDGFPRK